MHTCTLKSSGLAITLAFALSTPVLAEGRMSKADYKAAQEKITAEFKAARASCGSLSGNPRDLCNIEAKGKESVSNAELDASYRPSAKANYEVLVAKAEAGHALAKERCDDLAGNAKDVCLKEAKSAEVTAIANAQVQMKTSDANATANTKSSEARSKAEDKKSEARQEASADKRDAQYGVAKEKCDSYAGNAKDRCLEQAKQAAGK